MSSTLSREQSSMEVVCRLEYLPYLQTKIFVLANAIAVIMGMAGIIGLAVLKADESSKRFIASNQLPIANTVILCFCVTFLLAALIMVMHNVRLVRDRPWDDLRKNMINTHVAMVVALLGLMTCLLAANILVLTTSCWWLQPPAQAFEVLNFFDTTFTNIIFALLLLQSHIMCTRSRLFLFIEHRCQPACLSMLCFWRRKNKGTPDNKGTLQTKPTAEEVVRAAATQQQHGVHKGDEDVSCKDTPCTAPSVVIAEEREDPGKHNEKQGEHNGNHIGDIEQGALVAQEEQQEEEQAMHDNGQPGVVHDNGKQRSRHVTMSPAESTDTHGRSKKAITNSKLQFPKSFKHSSAQLPPTAIGYQGGTFSRYFARHKHIWIMLVITETLTIVSLIEALAGARQPPTPGARDAWRNGTTAAIQAFTTYFGESTQPIWQGMADAQQPPQPWNQTLQMGRGSGNTTANMHVFGPDLRRAPNGTNVFLIDAVLPPKEARPDRLKGIVSELIQPAGVNNSLFSFWATEAWIKSLFAPWLDFCANSGAEFVSVYDALENNTAVFRQQYNLPPCSDAPAYDATCVTTACPVSLDGGQAELGMFIVYIAQMAVYVAHLLRALQHMKTYAYTRYRLANTWLRLQLREGMVVVIFILFAMLILTAVNRSACSSRIISVLGVIPISFMWSILLLCRSYYIAPTLYNPKHTVLMERQMFAWAATEVGDMARERTHPEEPVFSYETALLMLFWSILAYRETKAKSEAPEPVFNLEHGKSMDGLVEHEIVIVPQHDFAAVLAWGPGKMFMTFRGTATLKNVSVDLNALQRRHPHVTVEQTSCCVCRNPNVHKGFWASWESGRDRVLTTVRTVLTNPQYMDETSVFTLSMTGHSLGGALATLAAWDVHELITDMGLQHRTQLLLYTYGAPQAGNHTFARLYKAAIPNAWDIVNDSDVVPRSTKYMRVYKRTGNRVIISKSGDLLCRPSWMEMNVKNSSKSSMHDHLIGSYRAAFAAIAAAQFNVRKSVAGGGSGVRRLWQETHSRKLMELVLGTTMEEFSQVAKMEHEDEEEEVIVPQSMMSAMMQTVAVAKDTMNEMAGPAVRFGERMRVPFAMATGGESMQADEGSQASASPMAGLRAGKL